MAGPQRELTPFQGDLEPGEAYEGLKFADLSFDEAAAGNCHFLDCEFVNTSFGGGATLLRVSFGGCTLTGADFTKVTCTDVDLRGAGLGITAGLESLRGVTIDSVQLVALAPLLARQLGITVAD